MEDIGSFLWYHRSMKKDLCGGMLHGSFAYLILDFTCLPAALLIRRPPGAQLFLFYVFTDLICLPTSGPSGGSIFLLVKKDRGERHAKGLRSRPLETAFSCGTLFAESVPDEFALVPRPNFNQGRRYRLSPPLRAYRGAVERVALLRSPDCQPCTTAVIL